MGHHILYIGMTHYVLPGSYFLKAFPWLSFGELSTPFLHIRWILIKTGKGNHPLYFGASLGFALTFLATRTFAFGLGLIDTWSNRNAWEEISELWGVVVGFHLTYLLNLFWSFKVV